MKFRLALIVLAALTAGCSGLPQISTSSILGVGGETKTQAQPTPVQSYDTPSNRAYELGANSARAQKCGYNFDAAALKTSFLQSEAASGRTVDELTRLDRIYTVGFNGTAKGIRAKQGYCNTTQTKKIKSALTRYLAGNFASVKRKQVVQTGALDWFDTKDESDGPKTGTKEWWDAHDKSVRRN